GYRPAIGAIIDRLKVALGGQCLPRKLNPDKNGQVQCLILEARNTGKNLTQDQCDAFCSDAGMNPGRQPVQTDHRPAVDAAKQDPSAANSKWDCFCEIAPTSGPAQMTCQTAQNAPMDTYGWCYIDATVSPPIGDPKLVANCPDTEKHLIRFTGQ